MPPDKPSATVLSQISGHCWITSRVGRIGGSPTGRWVWRHRTPLLVASITMPGAALLCAKVEALGLAPAGQPGDLWPGVAAIIAAAIAFSPRLRLGVLVLMRLMTSALTTALVLIGAAVAAAVLFWDELGPVPAWTLDEAVTHLRSNAPTLCSSLICLWLLVCICRLSYGFGPVRGVVAFDRKMAARHEAAHALVASVLGLSVEGAWVLHRPDGRGVGGTVRLGTPPAASTPEALYDLLVRRMAVNVSGVAGARGKRPFHTILHELAFQGDWIGATELSWIGASFHPDRVLVWSVLEAVVPALHTASWTAAIADAAKALLRAGGDPVSPETFAAIAHRFRLALPAVEALAACSNLPTRGTAA